MKFLSKLILLLSFILPYGLVTADTHDDATMDVIEHSSADHYENEIELPETEDDHGPNHDKDDHGPNHDESHEESHEEKEDSQDDSSDDKEDSQEDSSDDKEDSQEDSSDDKEDSSDSDNK